MFYRHTTAIGLILAVLFCTLGSPAALAREGTDFSAWLSHFRTEALQHGISPQTLEKAFAGISANPRVIELDRKQPEKKMGYAAYRKTVVSQARIDQGRQLLRDHWSQLQIAQNRYGVPAEILVSLWGIETNYGENTGGFDLIESLATLAWEGRRAAYFKKELIAALQILQAGHISRKNFKGSWAGAMGQNQFMPSSWKTYAVDGNGDGRKDIWTTRADVFASSANYLAMNGWNNSYPWGWAVRVPDHASLKTGMDHPRDLQDWIKAGVRLLDGGVPQGAANLKAALVIPDGGEGRAYLVTSNYKVIMSWNRSTYFAVSVGSLGDLIKTSRHTQKSGSPAAYNN